MIQQMHLQNAFRCDPIPGNIFLGKGHIPPGHFRPQHGYFPRLQVDAFPKVELILPFRHRHRAGDFFLLQGNCALRCISIQQNLFLRGFLACEPCPHGSIHLQLPCFPVIIHRWRQPGFLHRQISRQVCFRVDALLLQITAEREFFRQTAQIPFCIRIQQTDAEIAPYHGLAFHRPDLLVCQPHLFHQDLTHFRLGLRDSQFFFYSEFVLPFRRFPFHTKVLRQGFDTSPGDVRQYLCFFLLCRLGFHPDDRFHTDLPVIDNLAVQMLQFRLHSHIHICFQPLHM